MHVRSNVHWCVGALCFPPDSTPPDNEQELLLKVAFHAHEMCLQASLSIHNAACAAIAASAASNASAKQDFPDLLAVCKPSRPNGIHQGTYRFL